jgi:hypothetical protein
MKRAVSGAHTTRLSLTIPTRLVEELGSLEEELGGVRVNLSEVFSEALAAKIAKLREVTRNGRPVGGR